MLQFFCSLCQYEPVVTPGNELMVHHILLYRCPISAAYDGVQELCFYNRTLPQCFEVILAWAIGGEVRYLML